MPVILYVFGGMAILFVLTSPFVVLTHELGHAGTALLLTPGKVTMYIGSHGDPTRSFRLRTGRLESVFSYRVWRWGYQGLCVYEPDSVSIPRHMIITLAGPVASVLVALPAAYLAFRWNVHGATKLWLLSMASLAVLYLITNLWPAARAVQLADGSTTLRDGAQLYRLWQYQRMIGRLHRAGKLYDDGHFLKAAQLLERVLPAAEHQQDVYRLMILAYQQAKAYARADAHLRRYFALYQPTADDCITAGYVRSQLGQHAESMAAYSQALDIDPRNPMAWNNAGYQLLELQRYVEAVVYLDHAIRLQAHFAFAHNNRGFARLQLGQFEEGLADIRRSLSLEPHNAYGHRNLGIYYLLTGQPEQALQHFDLAYAADPATHRLDYYRDQALVAIDVARNACLRPGAE